MTLNRKHFEAFVPKLGGTHGTFSAWKFAPAIRRKR
jgi:hypothetical protein